MYLRQSATPLTKTPTESLLEAWHLMVNCARSYTNQSILARATQHIHIYRGDQLAKEKEQATALHPGTWSRVYCYFTLRHPGRTTQGSTTFVALLYKPHH